MMEFFPRHYSIPRDGCVTSIVVHNAQDLLCLRTELEILRRAQRHVVFRCTPIGQAPAGRYNQADRKELKKILRDAQHPLVEEMIDHIDRAFPSVRKEIIMSVVNDEAHNIVQEAVEVGAIDKGEQSSTSVNKSSAEVAIDMLEEAEAKLATLVDDSSPTTQDEPLNPDTDPAVDQVGDHQMNTESPLPDVESKLPEDALTSDAAKEEVAPQDVDEKHQTQNEAATTDAQVLNDIEDAVAALTEPSTLSNESESPSTTDMDAHPEEAHPQVEDTTDNALEVSTGPAQQIDHQGDQSTDNYTAASEIDDNTSATTDEFETNASSDDMTNHAPEFTTPDTDANTPATPTPRTPENAYMPERTQQAVDEIEVGIRKLADVINSQVQAQWTQANETLSDIVEKRSQLEQQLTETKDMFETLVRSRKEAAISRDAADVARREAELFRDDLRKLRDDASKDS